MAARARSELAQAEFMTDAGQIDVTLSIGLSSYLMDGESLDDTIKRADKALYDAKELGKDRIIIHQI